MLKSIIDGGMLSVQNLDLLLCVSDISKQLLGPSGCLRKAVPNLLLLLFMQLSLDVGLILDQERLVGVWSVGEQTTVRTCL